MAHPKITAADHGKRLARGPVTIGALTERIAKPALGKRGFAGGEILNHWPTIVGPELAAFAVPLQVKFPRGKNAGATLLLRISSGAAATMLHLKTPLILERVNRYFGYAAIDKVQAAQGPLPRATKQAKAAEPMESSDSGTSRPSTVAEALSRLGAAVQRRDAQNVDDTPSSHHTFPTS